ncbi:MAG: serine/threonine protein kinase [Acidobacteriota bacterium]
MNATTIADYRILRSLGEGLVGESFVAEDPQSQAERVIKVLAKPIHRNPSARIRFVRAAEEAASLAHPHIRRVFQVGKERARTFVACEFVKGKSLKEKLEEGALPLEQALEIATQIGEALSLAHRQGIIHQNLKPSNVILSEEGVKVTDFGLTKGIPVLDYVNIGQEKESFALLTMAYMSPEQLRVHHLDARSDVFCLGVMLYEMITGENPFRQSSFTETVEAVLERPLPQLSQYVGEPPPALQILVSRSVAKDLGERYPSVDELRAEMAAIDAG